MQPVFFKDGIPVATTYTLGKSVPSDAKFTDTTYSTATTATDGLMRASDKAKLDGVSAILPSDTTEIQTKYRIAKKAYTGGSDTIWWYKLCKFPINNGGNGSSAIISGRIGGWVSGNMSYINAIVWNRDNPGISLIDIAAGGGVSAIWDCCDLELYVDSDGTVTLYLKCKAYFVYDLNVEGLQLSTGTIIYDGTYITTTPSGALTAKASTATNRIELYNNSVHIGGNTVVQSWKFQNVSVPASNWGNWTAPISGGRPYYANVWLDGITPNCFLQVVFNPNDIATYNFAPTCEALDGGVQIYAETAPTVAITIPTIIAEKV